MPKLFKNLNKTRVGYTFVNDIKLKAMNTPPEIINSPNFLCPAISSTHNRIVAMYPKISAEFTIDLTKGNHFNYEINKKHHNTNKEMHQYLLENVILDERNKQHQFQLLGDICFVTDDKDLEIITTLSPDVKMENCNFINGAFYPYAWIRTINSSWQVKHGSKLIFDRNKPILYVVFNKPITLEYIENDKVKSYMRENYDITHYVKGISYHFKNALSRRPKRFFDK